MKAKFIIAISVLVVILIATVVFLCYKIGTYRKDFETMFGDDGFYIEEITDESMLIGPYTKVCNFSVPRSNYEKEFGTLESYLNSLGYYHNPDEREGACYFFYNEKGDKIEALRSVYNNYLEWMLLWENGG